jgi:hypothetical protein
MSIAINAVAQQPQYLLFPKHLSVCCIALILFLNGCDCLVGLMPDQYAIKHKLYLAIDVVHHPVTVFGLYVDS